MAVWSVPERRWADQRTMASFGGEHCISAGHPLAFNLYTMIHGKAPKTAEDGQRIARRRD